MARKKITVNEDGDEEIGQENMIMQLRKVVSLRGNKMLTFSDGKQASCSVPLARTLLHKYEQLRTSDQKIEFAATLVKSLASFQETAIALISTVHTSETQVRSAPVRRSNDKEAA